MSLRLDWCTHQAARYACERWHYSRTLPTPPLVKIGVWEHDRFIGCVLFSRGASAPLGKPYDLRHGELCELTRVALTAHDTPTTRIVAVAIRLLCRHAPGLRLIVSFADPNAGHVGTIYQAGNWIYCGTTSGAPKFRDKHGRVWHSRQVAASGIKTQYGTPRRVPRIADCERIPELGKYRYLMPLDAATRDRVEQLRKPYPQPRAGSIAGDASAVQAGEGGSRPTPALTDQTCRPN